MAYFWTSSVNLLKYTESAGNNKSRLPNISVRVWNSYVLKLRRKWSKKWLHFPILNLYFSLKLHSIYVYFFVMRLGFSYCRIKSVVFDTKSAGSRSPCLLPYSFKSPIELYITRFFWSLLLQLAQSVHIPRFIFFSTSSLWAISADFSNNILGNRTKHSLKGLPALWGSPPPGSPP